MAPSKDSARQPEYLHPVYWPHGGGNQADRLIDIVFVHGLNPRSTPDFAKATWTHENGNFWPEKQLPQRIGTARILIFSYNSQVAWDVSSNGIQEHANNLLDRLSGARESQHTNANYVVPIIFIAHSLGGLVVKQALVTAKNNDAYSSVRNATYGLVFFAVPHQGGHGATLGAIAKNIVLSVNGDSRNDLVESLKKNSLFQENQAMLFRHQLEDYQVVSIIEDRPTKFVKFLGRATSLIVVDNKSATLGLAGTREKVLTVNSNHSEVCQFESDDQKFEPVKRAIGNLADNAIKANQAVAENREQVNIAVQDTPMRKKILDTISPGAPDMAIRLHRILKRTCNGTAHWLQERPDYVNWLVGEGTSLWVRGKEAGAGKSHIAARTISLLLTSPPESYSVIYLFCHHDDPSTLVPTSLAKALFFQIMLQVPAGAPVIASLYEDAHDPSLSWQDLTPVLTALDKLLHAVGPQLLVVDGLDEIVDTTDMVELLRHLLIDCESVKVLAVSRSTEEIEESLFPSFDMVYDVQNTDVDADICTFLEAEIAERKLRGKPRRLKIKDPALESAIVSRLQKGANGMFLWASCMLDEICSARTDDDIVASLDDLPSGASMHNIYARMQGKILAMTQRDNALARKALAWILTSARPMTLHELAIALPLGYSSTTVSPSAALTDPSEVLFLCGGFVEQEDGQARIIHASASQYLFSEHASALASDPRLDGIVLMTCVDFLLSDHETNYAIDLDGAFRDRIAWRRGAYDYYHENSRQHKADQVFGDDSERSMSLRSTDWSSAEAGLSDYCLRCWTFHAQRCQQRGIPYTSSALRIFREREVFELWFLNWLDGNRGIMDDLRRDVCTRDYEWEASEMPALLEHHISAATPHLHPVLANLTSSDIQTLTAYLGLKDCLETMRVGNVWTFDGGSFFMGNSPLHGAAAGKSEDVCNFLLRKNAPVDTTNGLGQTPLLLAAQAGSDTIVELLIRHGALLDAQDRLGFSALHYVATEDWAPGSDHRRLRILGLLKGASSLLSQQAPSRPPNFNTLQLILKPEGASGGNALCFAPAAMLGYRLDLTPGEDMDLEGKGAPGSDNTYYAIYNAETFTDYAILDPPERTRALTPLHRAINESQAILVPLFLHLGSDINEIDSDGRPLLHKATRQAGWAPRLCKDLVSAGASLNTLDEQGRTPLHHAVVLGLYETAEYYLENGADVDAQDHSGSTPIHLLCNAGCLILDDAGQTEKTIDVLLRFYVNLDLEDNNGFKPLELALFNKWILGCHKFIQAGARLSQSQTTIHFLGIIAGLEDVDFRAQPWPRQPFLPRELLSLLLEIGADINHKERLMHCSPLNFAVYKGYTELVDFLIGRGARLNTIGPSGLLPIFIVLASPEIKDLDIRLRIAKSLLRAGANPEEYQQGMTPLSFIVMMMNQGKAEFAALFIEAGADIALRMSTKQTYLDLAIMLGRKELALIKVLLQAPRRSRGRTQDDLVEIFEEPGIRIWQMPGENALGYMRRSNGMTDYESAQSAAIPTNFRYESPCFRRDKGLVPRRSKSMTAIERPKNLNHLS